MLRLGAAAGVQGLVTPGAHASGGSARGRFSVSDGSTFQAWKGSGQDQVWWSRLNGYTWTVPQPVGGALFSFRPALATIGS
ncbi:hypothetical protein AF335_08875 [Streptomyces eurocidicus]|uniref:Uncharacterized protein n=1 Tax=Streptomyces eurocidicus TaxID=66423 RepID=A0A2N8P0U7_STREU|nr:hypothetical protein AF335_08875 [Streptomyces eurocidicus]